MQEAGKSGRRGLVSFGRDRGGLAVVEAALVLPVFLGLVFLIIGVGVYHTTQSSLDTGVLLTAESLASNMAVGSSYTPPTAAALTASIVSNGGSILQASNLLVDVHQLSTLSAGTVQVRDGIYDWGGSGSILVVRVQSVVPFLPESAGVTITSSSLIRRPPY
jgi:Flp pilus assembly protein TadG